MLNRNSRGKLFARRAFILAGIKSALLFGLASRLYYLQIVKSDEYKTFSDSNRIKPFLIPPLRGRILDRNGEYLAINRNYYRVLFDPETKASGQAAVEKLSLILGLDDKGRGRMLKKLTQHKSRRAVTLYEHATWEEVARVEVNSPDLPGVSIDVGQTRYFPMGEISPHMIGYLGPVSEEEIKTNSLLNHPDFKIGRSGVEKVFEATLRGKAGVRHMEVDAFGLSVGELSKEDSISGEDLTLALDRRLHEFISTRMQGQSGSAVVIDIHTGEVLAMASSPGFDPNKFTYGVSSDYWEQLLGNDEKPLINKAISNQYPPGSTFKLVVTLAALKEGVDPHVKVYCPGHLDLGRRRFHCWKKGGHGHVNMEQALMHSCNTYFYTVAKKIGMPAIAAMAGRFGLGEPLGINLPGEKPGLVPTEEWKRERFNDSWQSGDTLNLGIGQGFLLATPLQLAVMVARVASGRKVTPRITPPKVEEGVILPEFETMGLPEEHLDIVRKGMYQVVNVPGGTAYGSRITDKAFSMAGKTGTSQVISKKMLASYGDTMTEEEKNKTENHALFVGYGPVDAPRYAVSVIIEHGGGGSAAAAPVARDILHTAQKLDVGKKA